ncbi:MAG: peptidylprolyl isomerase [Candidatus Binataceae bacterium]
MRIITSMRFAGVVVTASLACGVICQAAGCSLLSRVKGPGKSAATATATATATDTPLASEATPEATPDALVVPHQTVGHIVASVDGEPITAHDVLEFSTAVGHPVKVDDIANDDEAKAALKALISQKLVEKELQHYADKVDEEQVDSYMEMVRRDKHLSPEQFKAALAQSGMSMDDFRKHAREEIEKEMMFKQQVRDKVDITQADIQAYYDAHKADFTVTTERLRVAQILIGAPQNATPQQVALLQAKADKIRKEAFAGADFSDLARKYSDDSSKSSGGELGWFGPQDIMDQIYAAVKNLKPGDISQVVRTNHGFHILKLEEHQVPGPRPLDDVKDQIRNQLIDQRANEQLENWIDTDLAKQHDVETFY